MSCWYLKYYNKFKHNLTGNGKVQFCRHTKRSDVPETRINAAYNKKYMSIAGSEERGHLSFAKVFVVLDWHRFPKSRNCIYFRTLTPTMRAAQTSFYDRFSQLDSVPTFSGGQFYTEDFSSFDSLEFKKKQNARTTIFRFSTAWFFISTET